MVDDGKDGIVTIGLGEADDEVHGYLLEWKGGLVCRDFVHCWASAMCNDLVLLARRTPLDVFCDPRAHVWPPVVALGLRDGFIASGVSGYKTFVHHPHNLSFDRKVWGDRQLSIFPPA